MTDAKRLAIIDDHELVREGLQALLLTRGSGAWTLAYVGDSVERARAAGVDCALLDIELGPSQPAVGENCLSLVEAGVGVLLISAHDDPAAIRSGMSSGALGFVPKRVSYEELAEALAFVARDEMYLSVDLAALLASAPETPDLSPRELDALRLYASGLKLTAVARRMEISPHTVKEYLDRVRTKYQQVGRPARTRTQLYAEASRDGLLQEPGSTGV